MTEIIELDGFDLILILILLGLAVALSMWQKLGLEGQLLLASARSLLQLIVLGYLLSLTFVLNSPIATVGILLIFLTLATVVVRNRISKTKRILPIIWGALFISTTLTLAYVLLLMIQPDPWYNPQYLIPLAGILIGNAMNGAALSGERLASTINNRRLEIETHLSLGASPQQVTENYRREAIRAGLIPTLNQMTVVGLVTLPGFFSGQILGGIDPLNAASYQILILFMQAFTSLLATLLVTQGIYRQYFNQNWQLNLSDN